MVVHKHTRLLPMQRKELADDYFVHRLKKKELMCKYRVSYPTVNKILSRAKHKDYTIHKHTFACKQPYFFDFTRCEAMKATNSPKMMAPANIDSMPTARPPDVIG